MYYMTDKQIIQSLRAALEDIVDHYIQLIKSGDCGNWNPNEEKVVINARKALDL